MSFPAAIVPVSVTGKIVSGSDGVTPAVGTVTFTMPGPLYDTADNVLLSAVTYTATLNGTGSFTISLPPTNSPNVSPSNWEYDVHILTNPHSEYGAIQVPYNGGTVSFNSAYTPGLAAVGGNTFVPASGGTMTGDLILSGAGTDLSVGGTSTLTGNVTVGGLLNGTFSGVSANFLELVATMLSGGVISGGKFTINADPTKLNISAMIGYIVDYDSSVPISSVNPSLTRISLAAQTGLSLTGPGSQTTTWWMVNSVGAIVQQAARPTPEQRRQNIVLGATAQFSGVIFIAQTFPESPSHPNQQYADLADSLGPFMVNGSMITVSANGANLTLNTSGGRLFARSFAQAANYRNPHQAALAAQTPVSCRRASATAVLPTLQTVLDVANYDLNGAGVVAAIPGGTNVASNFGVYAFATTTTTDQMAIQYGQAAYSSLANATAALGAGSHITNPLFVDGALIAYISVIRTATNLSDPSQCVITPVAKFSI